MFFTTHILNMRTILSLLKRYRKMWFNILATLSLISFVICMFVGVKAYTEDDHKFGKGWKNPFARVFLILAFIPVLNIIVIPLALAFAYVSVRAQYLDKVQAMIVEYYCLKRELAVIRLTSGRSDAQTREADVYRCIECNSNHIAVGATSEDEVVCGNCEHEQVSLFKWNAHNNWSPYMHRYLNSLSLFSAIAITRRGFIDEFEFTNFVEEQRDESY